MAQEPPIGDIARKVTDEALIVAAEVDLAAFYDRMEAEMVAALKEFKRQGLVGAELAKAVGDRLRALSPVLIESMGRASTSEAFNLGRNIAAQENIGAIKRVVRTEILDTRTCPPCRQLDGNVYVVNTKPYFEDMPPNKCNGRDFCRGFFMYLTEEASA